MRLKKTKTERTCANSTIAMSAYNVLAIARTPKTTSEIWSLLSQTQHPDLGKGQLQEAMRELAGRGWVKRASDTYACRDMKRRLIISRDRSDAECKDGGWNGWMARDEQRGLLPIEEIIK